MNDRDRFFRLVLGHENDRHNLTIQVMLNRKDLPLRWNYTKVNNAGLYKIELDFLGGHSNWEEPNRREQTGEKEICWCVIDVEDEVLDGILFFDVSIIELDKVSDKSHDGTVHLPGGD